jgi:hypothetical protein
MEHQRKILKIKLTGKPSMKSSNTSKLILFLGADWWGSDARALAVSLRQRGHCLIEVQYEDYFPLHWSNSLLKLFRRVIRRFCVSNYNSTVRQHVDNSSIDFVLVFKGNGLMPQTLEYCRKRGIPCYLFYPDVGFATYGKNIVDCLPLYDAVFTTKSFHLRDERLSGRVKCLILVSHGFDPDVHRMACLNSAVQKHYECDVSFVGCWSPEKERLVGWLIANVPDAHVRLWGPGWKRSAEAVRLCWAGRGAFGDESVIIYQCSKINLGLLTAAHWDVISGDQTTVRTWQIPAAGGFMLHEDTQEVRAFLADGVDVALFDGQDELVKQVRRFLADDVARRAMAEAGRQRVLAENYTYVGAANQILAHHEGRAF